MQTHVAVNTQTLTNKCHTNPHTVSWTRTHAFFCSTLIARALPAVRDLKREHKTTCLLIFPSQAKRDWLSNWSLLLCISHPMLNGSLSAIFSLTVYPCLCCSLLSPFLHVWSQSTRFCGVIFCWGQSNLKVPVGDGTWWRLRFGLKFWQMFLLPLPVRNLTIRSVTANVCDGVRGQHYSVSVFT